MRTRRILFGAAALLATLLAVVAPTPASAQTPTEGSATRLYAAYFLRQPEPAGLRYWVSQIDGGRSLNDVSEFFARSPEFINRYGSLTNAEFVDLIYRNVLGRPAEPAGRAFWLAALDQRTMTRGAVMVGFSESPEFVRKTGTEPPVVATPLGRPATNQRPSTPNLANNADPSVLVAGGQTYVFGSTNGVKLPIYVNPPLGGPVQVTAQPTEGMPAMPGWVDESEWTIRAPSPVVIGGRYYVYFAAPRKGAKNEHDDWCIGRAKAASPTGPYVDEGKAIYCGMTALLGGNVWGRGASDPEVMKAADGKLYLLVKVLGTTPGIGVLPLEGSGLPRGPNVTPTLLVKPSLPWHDGSVDSTMGSGALLENPSMTYDAQTKTYLLFYSAGQWPTPRYVTGFARCASPTGPCTIDRRAPFLVNGNGRSGPGGLSTFRGPDGVLRVAYHTWTAGQENGTGGSARRTHFQRLVVSGGDPNTQSVSLG